MTAWEPAHDVADPSYAPLVVEHFERPRNAGHFAPAPDVIVGAAGRRDQGVAFHLSARVLEGVIDDARFEAYGCPHCLAAGSWLTERLRGMDRQALQAWSWREAADVLQMPTEKRGRLLILEDAVRAMAQDWARRF